MARRRPRHRPIISKERVEEFRAAFTGGEIDSLVSVYRRAMAEALRILSDGYAALGSRRRAQALLQQYHELLAELRDESAAWISSNLPTAYQAGIQFGDEGVRGVRRAGVNLGKPQKAIFAQVHREAVQAIVTEMQRVTNHALAQIGRRVDDAFRKIGIQEVARGIAEGKTREQVSREIKRRLLAEGKLKFTDRLGRDWDLDRYAEMVARTTTRQAMTTGTVNRLREHNIELAQVSAHNAADFCIYYENVIVTVGAEPVAGYPPLSAINGGPPFHPNCAHVLTPFVISLATPEEKAAGKISAKPLTEDEKKRGLKAPDILNKTPAQLQRRFTKQFPERAREEGRRIRRAAARTRASIRQQERRAARDVPEGERTLQQNLSALGRKDVLLIGQLPAPIRRGYNTPSGEVILTGERREHYLERHPEMRRVEHLLPEVIARPSAALPDRRDPDIVILYREYEGRYLRASVLTREAEGRKSSIISFRYAKTAELEKHRKRDQK